MTEKTTIKATPVDAGCWIDGWLGQYAGAGMILTATSFGYDDDDVIDVARRHYHSMGPSGEPGITDDEHELLSEYVDEVEAWLNEHVAPTGYLFGWWEGEFFLGSLDWWEEGNA